MIGVARTATERACALWQRLLADYEPPPIDPAIDEALQAFMARRKEELMKMAG
jgi:trimethylamine---corrinoid protein Co-methyltransferase